MAAQLRDVSEVVHEVIAAYDKAAVLLRRVESRKDARDDSVAIQELHGSLNLGSMVVRGCFDSDSRKYGQAYTTGDFEARYQLQGILLDLKELVSSLQTALLDDESVAVDRLQNISDKCRTNVTVSLGTLSQRLAVGHDVVKEYLYSPQTHVSGSSYNGLGLSHSTSISTYSSARTSGAPSTPALLPEQHHHHHHHLAHLVRKDTGRSLQDSVKDWASATDIHAGKDLDELSLRRPSSHTLGPEDSVLFLSSNSPELLASSPPIQHLDLGAHTSPAAIGLSTASSQINLTDEPSQNRTRPDDLSRSLISYAHRIKRGDHVTLASDPLTASSTGTASTPFRSLPRSASLHPFPQESPVNRVATPLTLLPEDATNDKFHHDAPGALPGLGPQVNMYKLRPGLTHPPTHIDGMRVPIPPRSGARRTYESEPSVHTLRAAVDDRLQAQLRLSQWQQMQAHLELQQPGPPPQRPIPPTPVQQPSALASVRAESPGSPELVKQRSRVRRSPSQERPRRRSPLHRSPSTATPILLSRPLPALPVVPLSLPDEKNAVPFCKMAIRLFSHPRHLSAYTSKAFSTAQRPVGMNNMIPYWRCDKCFFEGPMAYQPGPLDKKGRAGKPEKVFDNTIRDSAKATPGGAGGTGGVLYRWAFLAKCHVALKQVPEGSRDGSYGSFSCLFCVAEGTARGWTDGAVDGMSIVSDQSREGSRHGPPVFGNVQSFMDHLQIHRKNRYWPGLEMQGRMKCVVGRIAAKDEDFDINLLPVEADDGC